MEASLSRAYTLAGSSEERLAIAVDAGNRVYFKRFKEPTGEPMPGPGFYREFLAPFIKAEMDQARIEELHTMTGKAVREREVELIDSLRKVHITCSQKLLEGAS